MRADSTLCGISSPSKQYFPAGTRDKGHLTIGGSISDTTKRKHLLTMQRGISARQLTQMSRARVTLVVPKSLHKEYPKVDGVKLVSVDEFLEWAGKLARL